MGNRTESAEPALGETLDFLRLIWAVDHGLQSTSKRMARTLGVTAPQRLVLRILGVYRSLSAGELAEVLHLHPSTLTGVLSRLEERVLIEREIDPADRRRAIFRLTEQGQALNRLQKGTVEQAVRRALQETAPEDLRAARAVLGHLARMLTGDDDQAAETEA